MSEKAALTENNWKKKVQNHQHLLHKVYESSQQNKYAEVHTFCCNYKCHSNFYGFITPNQTELVRTVKKARMRLSELLQTSPSCSSATDISLQTDRLEAPKRKGEDATEPESASKDGCWIWRARWLQISRDCTRAMLALLTGLNQTRVPHEMTTKRHLPRVWNCSLNQCSAAPALRSSD